MIELEINDDLDINTNPQLYYQAFQNLAVYSLKYFKDLFQDSELTFLSLFTEFPNQMASIDSLNLLVKLLLRKPGFHRSDTLIKNVHLNYPSETIEIRNMNTNKEITPMNLINELMRFNLLKAYHSEELTEYLKLLSNEEILLFLPETQLKIRSLSKSKIIEKILFLQGQVQKRLSLSGEKLLLSVNNSLEVALRSRFFLVKIPSHLYLIFKKTINIGFLERRYNQASFSDLILILLKKITLPSYSINFTPQLLFPTINSWIQYQNILYLEHLISSNIDSLSTGSGCNKIQSPTGSITVERYVYDLTEFCKHSCNHVEIYFTATVLLEENFFCKDCYLLDVIKYLCGKLVDSSLDIKDKQIPLHLKKYKIEWICTRIITENINRTLKNYNQIKQIASFLLNTTDSFLNLKNREKLWLLTSSAGISNSLVSDKIKILKKALKDSSLSTFSKWAISQYLLPSKIKTTTVSIHGVLYQTGKVGKKSLFINKYDDTKTPLCVEELALKYFMNLGWNGIHSENTFFTTLFGLIFWDILFSEVSPENVFLNSFQNAPLDLGYPSFYSCRSSAIDKRLEKIIADFDSVLAIITIHWDTHYNTQALNIAWSSWSLSNLIIVCKILGSKRIFNLCKFLVNEYSLALRGCPDLLLWKEKENKIMLVEVKGPNDTLSMEQKHWILTLKSFSIPFSLCKVFT